MKKLEIFLAVSLSVLLFVEVNAEGIAEKRLEIVHKSKSAPISEIKQLKRGDILFGKVERIKDGDTFDFNSEKMSGFFTCRMYGIDAPETPKRGRMGQSCGDEAEQFLKRAVINKNIQVTIMGKEVRVYPVKKDGNVISKKEQIRMICLAEKNKSDINLELVKHGYAWAYVQYLKRPHASEYLGAEKTAREKKLGIWKERNPEPPWEFRKRIKKHKKIQ